jgi:hypothetical protein
VIRDVSHINNRFNCSAGRKSSRLAAQPIVGLLPEWRDWIGRDHSVGSALARTSLRERLWNGLDASQEKLGGKKTAKKPSEKG